MSQLWKVSIVGSGRSWQGVTVLLAVLVVMFGVTFFDVFLRIIQQPNDANWTLAYQLTVDAYCTLYVLFEALITIYAIFFCRAGKYLIAGNERSGFRELQRNRMNLQIQMIIKTMALLFLALYAGYHLIYIDLVHAGRLENRYFANNFHFFYIVCGFLWVFINGVAAFYAYRIYKMVQHIKAHIDAGYL